MSQALRLCVVLCLTMAPAPCFAGSVALQTVDLNDRGMSTEGGLTTLYRVTKAKSSYCRIAVIHFGEMGKMTYAFAFNPRLFSAVMREYDYDHPMYQPGPLKVTLGRTETLETKVGAAKLPAAFDEYRSFFDPGQLAKCSGR